MSAFIVNHECIARIVFAMRAPVHFELRCPAPGWAVVPTFATVIYDVWSPHSEAVVTERERLEREIYQLTLIINANRDALAFKMTRLEDRPALQQQINIRTARRDELQREVDALST